MSEHLQSRAYGGIVRGIAVAALFVLVNGIVALNWVPSSYQQFSWQAYAEVVYTETPTATPSETPTATPTCTPTETPVANGGSCETASQCASDFCVEGVCCNTICDQPGQSCRTGVCANAAPVPAVSHRTLLFIALLMGAIGCFALTPLRFGRRR